MGMACSTNRRERKAYTIMVGKPGGRPIHRTDHNIKIDLRHIKCGGMDWIDLAQDKSRGGLL
jgi:hypothetical protein